MLQVLPFPMEGPSQEQLKDPAVFVHEASELWQLWVPLAHSSISTKHNMPKCVIKTVFFAEGNRRRRKTLHCFHLPFTLKISNKTKLTSAGVSIAWISCFTGAYVQSHSITAHCIDVTAVRIGRALVDIWEEEWENLLIGLQRTLYQY